jgi:hypothetical protein
MNPSCSTSSPLTPSSATATPRSPSRLLLLAALLAGCPAPADTGKPALYLSRLMTRSIVGLEKAESDALLARLFDHCEEERFVYAHSWQLGDLLLWDNRCLNHARNDFPSEEQRHLRRVTVSDPA